MVWVNLLREVNRKLPEKTTIYTNTEIPIPWTLRFMRGKNLGWCFWDLSRSRKLITFLLEPQGIHNEEIYIYIYMHIDNISMPLTLIYTSNVSWIRNCYIHSTFSITNPCITGRPTNYGVSIIHSLLGLSTWH
jgi:hypothetical protein